MTPEASSSDLEVWRSSEILIPACIKHWSHLTPETTYELFEGESARVTINGFSTVPDGSREACRVI